jgi:aromatic amino acid aminotransferase I / 2-aminoadipate transaminase
LVWYNNCNNFLYLPTGLISLGGGLPSSEYFPIEEINLRVPNSPHFEAATVKSGGIATARKHDIRNKISQYGAL